MGFLSDLADGVIDVTEAVVNPGGVFDGAADAIGQGVRQAGRFVDDKLLGGDEAKAAKEAAALQEVSGQTAIGTVQQAGQDAQGFLTPFQQLGQQGLSQASFLTDPDAQFSFLQNNPLFQMALDNANNQTWSSAAAGGRLSSDDTRQQFVNNALLSASPLISRQQNAIQGLLNQGLNVAQTQAQVPLNIANSVSNIQTGIGNAQASGLLGAQQARSQGVQNALNLGGSIFGAFGGGSPGSPVSPVTASGSVYNLLGTD